MRSIQNCDINIGTGNFGAILCGYGREERKEDMKAVQGDSGHAQMKMVADVYSHIIDEDRCINAQRFEDAFYSQAKAPEPAIQEIEEKETGTTTPESDTAKILELLKNPETAALLKQIVSAL